MTRNAIAAALIAAIALAPGVAVADDDDKPFGSVYSTYGFGTFVRGGLNFANIDSETSVSSPYGSIGAWKPVGCSGALCLRIEAEGLAMRERISGDIPTESTEYDFARWSFAALVGARLDYRLASNLTPFVSFGAGPAYVDGQPAILRADEVVLLEATDGSVQVAYGGRAGIELHLGEGLAIEAGYRYLGVTTNPTTGLHSAEFGVSQRF